MCGHETVPYIPLWAAFYAYIFHPEKGIPPMTAARLQRYALFLAGFEYKIEYKNTTEHCNADGLFRLPLKQKELEEMGVDS